MNNSAAIGGGCCGDGGEIIIAGGTVTARVIGCGTFGEGGSVTISGGSVIAGGLGGQGATIGGVGSTVTITGGTVMANESYFKYVGQTINGYIADTGIGGTNSTVVITGGVVKAIGGGMYDENGEKGKGGPAIGGGDVIISGGDITAWTGYYGAAIGANGKNEGGSVTITGGTIYAATGAINSERTDTIAIGNGMDGSGCEVTISGGTFTTDTSFSDTLANVLVDGYGFRTYTTEDETITYGGWLNTDLKATGTSASVLPLPFESVAIATDKDSCDYGEDVTVSVEVTLDERYSEATYNWSVNGASVEESTSTYTMKKPNAGTYIVSCTVTSEGDSRTLSTTITVDKVGQTAPSVSKTDETVFNKADGKISGLTTAMEWRKDGESTYTKVTDAELTGLEAGIYYVRYAETSNFNASPETKIVIDAGQEVIKPATGDNSNIWMWFAVMLVSGMGIFGLSIYDRKRKAARNFAD